MDHIEVVFHHGGKFVNEGCLKYEGEIETLCFGPDVWCYFVVVSVVKSLGYDGFKELWYSVGCGPILDDRLQALTDDVGAMQMVTEVPPFAEVIEEGGEGEELDEGVPGDGERIQVVVGQDEEVVGQAEEIVGEAEEVDGEQNGNDVQRTEAAEVQLDRAEADRIEVDRAEGDGIEVDGDEVQANISEVDRAEAGEVEVEVEVEAEKDGQMDDVQVGDWSSTEESNGEMDNEDGLVDIDVQCDVSESFSDLEVEVEPFQPGCDFDMDEEDIDDSSWFNDD
ncbi:hypothetical protein V8G54_010161 [Vigna mungo]|uniref:PB1-like domain-containing protein n=1 Tax=Vigna mungo TaxID=3915 RepID=A0AAQ3S677_VIGMU